MEKWRAEKSRKYCHVRLEQAKTFWDLTHAEAQRGFTQPLRTMQEIDKLFGKGQWRLIDRFLHLKGKW